jgi:hypothetical protein
VRDGAGRVRLGRVGSGRGLRQAGLGRVGLDGVGSVEWRESAIAAANTREERGVGLGRWVRWVRIANNDNEQQ